MPALSSRSARPPEREDRLAVAVLILHELERPTVSGKSSPRRWRRPATTTASNSTDGAALNGDVDLDARSPLVEADRAQPRADEPRHGAGRRQRAGERTRSASPSTPSATRIATRRARMLPSPGRANSESDGDAATSGVTLSSSAPSASARAARACRGPSATASRQLRRDVHQARHHALAHRRRLHPRQLEAEGVDDVRLLDRRLAVPEQRAPACSDRRSAPALPRTLCASGSIGSGNETKPAAPAWNGQPPPSEFGS